MHPIADPRAGYTYDDAGRTTTNCADSSDPLNFTLGYGASNTNSGSVMSQTITMTKQAAGAVA